MVTTAPVVCTERSIGGSLLKKELDLEIERPMVGIGNSSLGE